MGGDSGNCIEPMMKKREKEVEKFQLKRSKVGEDNVGAVGCGRSVLEYSSSMQGVKSSLV